jgi:hypothetical protein
MNDFDSQNIAGTHSGIMLILTVLLFAAAGCGERHNENPFAALFPDAETVEGIVRTGDVVIYRDENLYDFLNGGAELYFHYGIAVIASRDYELPEESGIEVSIYDMGSPCSAFGIYSIFAYAGADRADIGNDAIKTAATLDFWKGKYYCKLMAYGGSERTEETMHTLARSIADRITPAGSRPGLVGRLPEEGRISGSEKYFMGPLGLNNIRYVASENVFNLGNDTEGVTAEYGDGEIRYMGYLIAYPDPESARAALDAYRAHMSSTSEETSRNGIYMYILKDGNTEAIALKGRHVAGVWDLPPGGSTGFIEIALAALPEGE